MKISEAGLCLIIRMFSIFMVTMVFLFAKVNATRDLQLRLQTRAFRRLAFTSTNLTKRAYKLLSSKAAHDKITLLLTMPEDKATLRSDPSADMEVSGRSSADALLFFRYPLVYLLFLETSRR